MNHRPMGFILLTTLFMLTIITVLILSLMQSLYLYIKLSNQHVRHHQTIYQLETVVKKIGMLQYDLIEESCFIDGRLGLGPTKIKQMREPYTQSVQRLKTKQGCIWIEGHQNYRYLISDLGLFPCLLIKSGGSHHWLVSVASFEEPNVILQVRFARRDLATECSLSDTRAIHEGIVSWHYAHII